MTVDSTRKRVKLDVVLVLEIMQFIKEKPRCTIFEMTFHFGVSRSYIYNQLRILEKYFKVKIVNYGSDRKPIRFISEYGCINKAWIDGEIPPNHSAKF